MMRKNNPNLSGGVSLHIDYTIEIIIFMLEQ